MHQTDACQFCEAPALIGFGKPGPSLTLIYWTCRECKRNNVSAWDWERHRLVACRVMQAGEAGVHAARAARRVQETLRQQARKKARARNR